ncbi:hypothetical protein BT96DRAFT_828838 [Gymnopus androsaceus JB14]|uniref:CCHC-type domain-containing protein n=1 Tax=Gymnopus androsaceus JB14 TaxID=1447944 RepID=A0A6A4H7K1_9AGAR|nr:hypothetical protein BT96DRAFT_828838 [Gymnopus androsaceus JB14]
MICSFADGEQANRVIRNGLVVQGKALEARKSLPEPRRCMKCHNFGHFAKGCKREEDACGRCNSNHRTSSCEAAEDGLFCALCKVTGHGASSRTCPTFIRRREALWARRADLHYKYFVSEDPETLGIIWGD